MCLENGAEMVNFVTAKNMAMYSSRILAEIELFYRNNYNDYLIRDFIPFTTTYLLIKINEAIKFGLINKKGKLKDNF